MDKQTSKQTLLEVGTRYLWEHGYHHSSLNDIVEVAHIPKGSFYYYFDSKEDFGLQSLDFFADNLQAGLKQYMEDETFPPLERLRHYFETSLEDLESLGWRQGCLIGNFAQEMSDQNEIFRQKVDALLVDWSAAIADCLRQAQEQNQLQADYDVQELADFCLNSWQGAILRMKVVKKTTPLTTFIHQFFDILVK